MVDPPVESASIQSSEVGFDGRLAGEVLAGVLAIGGIGVASDPIDRAPDGRLALLGRIVLIVAVPAGRGGGVGGWMVGEKCSFGGSTV